ncbi:20645_t:CDS:2 [Cetraspora pellucida]|uniref:20645_t:CDS:1 n=1 Tax=Cetraspora pellucida TaxID=1433469 RepID=A0A9N9FIY9_9GLOM|nr:20645_t:CDS:2 [Cetraspora pellucida]
MEPNNEPNMKPNNEPDMKSNNKPDMEPSNESDIEPNNESDIEPVESNIEPMETNLDCNDESSDESSGWTFTLNIFNGGIQSSQRAEATNSVIKKQLNYRNISLYDLFMKLEKKLATEPIDDIIKNFLMPTSLKKQQDQMNLSAQYYVTRVSHEDQYNKQIQEIDDKFEQLAVISISQFDISNFKVGVQPNYDTQAKTNTISLLRVGIKDLDQNLDNYQNIQKRYYTNQEKIKKWTFYSKLWDVACKATEIATNTEDYSLLKILNNYINRSIHESSFQTESQISSSSKENQVIEENNEVKQIQNPIKRYGKGRPSGRPTKKLRIQNSLEKEQLATASQNIDNNNSNIKKYKCSFCNSLSHMKACCSLNPKKNRQLLQELPL